MEEKLTPTDKSVMTGNPNTPKGTIIVFLLGVALLAISFFALSPEKKAIPPELIAVLRPEAIPLKPFTLTDQKGELFTEQQLKGKWSFFFFGYTFCPDICPTTLASLKNTGDHLKDHPEIKKNTQYVFVSVDPERDTLEVLSRYIDYFGPDFTGLTGFRNSVDDLVRQFGAVYIKEKETLPGTYLVSHTSSVFLVDPQARIVASFSPPHYAANTADLYKSIRELYQ